MSQNGERIQGFRAPRPIGGRGDTAREGSLLSIVSHSKLRATFFYLRLFVLASSRHLRLLRRSSNMTRPAREKVMPTNSCVNRYDLSEFGRRISSATTSQTKGLS